MIGDRMMKKSVVGTPNLCAVSEVTTAVFGLPLQDVRSDVFEVADDKASCG